MHGCWKHGSARLSHPKNTYIKIVENLHKINLNKAMLAIRYMMRKKLQHQLIQLCVVGTRTYFRAGITRLDSTGAYSINDYARVSWSTNLQN